MVLSVFLFLLSPHAEAFQGHRFEWTKPDLGQNTLCVEVDEATNGENFRMVMSDDYCPKLKTEFAWSIPENGFPSKCQKVDRQTGGEIYRREAESEKLCAKPPTVHLWIKAENDQAPNCYELDQDTHGKILRIPAKARLCPHTLDVNAAFARREPKFGDPRATGGGRMPASITPAEDLGEERDPKEFWEDPEDMIRHVPDGSRKGFK